MEPSFLRQKRVYARKEASESGLSESEAADSDADNAEPSSQSESHGESIDGDDQTAGTSDESIGGSEEALDEEAASISFGALAEAQEVLGKRKRINDDGHLDDEFPNPRENVNSNTEFFESEALERKAGKKDTRDFARASKHAPAELSSKKAVSRKREVVPSHKTVHRDPRFERLSGPLDTQKAKKNYAFLDSYRDDEINDLKTTIKKTKDLDTKEKLKLALLSMESRRKTQQMKDQRQEVLSKHRREEKEKVRQGKKPFYLKKADQKQLALVEQFKGMKGKQVEKAIEKRRKKQAGKLRKFMPDARRG